MTSGGAGAPSPDPTADPAGRLPRPDRAAAPWVAAYPPGVPAAYRWPQVALPRLLDDAARDFPAGAATCWAGRCWTWSDLQQQVEASAAALQRLGVAAGARVVLAATSPPVALAVAFATWRVGGVLVPVPPAATATDRAHLLAAAGPVATVVARDRARDWFHVDPAVVVATPDDLASPRRWPGRRPRPDVPPGTTAWRDLVVVGDHAAPGPAAVGPRDPAVLQPTRDRAGRRHLATLTHRQLVAAVLQARLWIPDMQAGREVLLCPAPPASPAGLVGGLLLSALSAATLVHATTPMPRRGRRPPAAPTLLVAHADEVPALVDAAERGELELSTLRAGLLAGDRLPDPVARRLGELSGQARVRRALALPEAGFLTHANPVYGRADPVQVGLPVTGTVAAVVDPADPSRPRPDGRAGQLVVAGPQVMAGYWGQEAATRAVRHDGWLLTDHLAVRDATGAFAIVGAVGDTVGQEVAP